ncbi:MAG: hypothetical protein ACE5HQ_11235 [Gemmatimonadota bacterium]
MSAVDRRRSALPEPVERIRHLMMAALDGELEDSERGELDAALRADSALREEWRRLRRLKEVTDTMSLREPSREVWDGYWAGVYRRLERGIGWILASAGAIVLVSWGVWEGVREMWLDRDTPLPVKAAVLALIVGLAVLLVSVIREKLFVRKEDPYKDVIR